MGLHCTKLITLPKLDGNLLFSSLLHELLKLIELLLGLGDHDLTTATIAKAKLLSQLIDELVTTNDEASLDGARLIVVARVHDTAVSLAGTKTNFSEGLKHDNLEILELAKLAGQSATNNTTTNDNNVVSRHYFKYVLINRNTLTLSAKNKKKSLTRKKKEREKKKHRSPGSSLMVLPTGTPQRILKFL